MHYLRPTRRIGRGQNEWLVLLHVVRARFRQSIQSDLGAGVSRFGAAEGNAQRWD